MKPVEPSENMLIGQAQHLIGALMAHDLLNHSLPEDKYLNLWNVVQGQLRCVNREGARAALAAQSMSAGCRVADVGFRWDGEKQQHFPSLLIEFDPVPVNGDGNAKGWRDRAAMAAMIASNTTPAQAQQAQSLKDYKIEMSRVLIKKLCSQAEELISTLEAALPYIEGHVDTYDDAAAALLLDRIKVHLGMRNALDFLSQL